MGQSRILHRTGYSLLYRRQGIYSFRKFVPKDLREIIGQREIKVSLRTNDFETASADSLSKSSKLTVASMKPDVSSPTPMLAPSAPFNRTLRTAGSGHELKTS